MDKHLSKSGSENRPLINPPYTVDEYAVIITTKNPQYPTIHLRVGYDGGLAREIASQIYSHCKLLHDKP